MGRGVGATSASGSTCSWRPPTSGDAFTGAAADQRRVRSRSGELTRKPGYLARAERSHRGRGASCGGAEPRRARGSARSRCCTRTTVMVAINKAPGMVVHPAPGSLARNAGERAAASVGPSFPRTRASVPGRASSRSGHVGRDRRRANTRRRSSISRGSFSSGPSAKRYLALVRGVVRRDELVIDAVVGRHPTDRKRMSTRTRRGREAFTRVLVRERFRTRDVRRSAAQDRTDAPDPRASWLRAGIRSWAIASTAVDACVAGRSSLRAPCAARGVADPRASDERSADDVRGAALARHGIAARGEQTARRMTRRYEGGTGPDRDFSIDNL